MCVSPDDLLPSGNQQASVASLEPMRPVLHRDVAIADIFCGAVDPATWASDSVFGMGHRHMRRGHRWHGLLDSCGLCDGGLRHLRHLRQGMCGCGCGGCHERVPEVMPCGKGCRRLVKDSVIPGDAAYLSRSLHDQMLDFISVAGIPGDGFVEYLHSAGIPIERSD